MFEVDGPDAARIVLLDDALIDQIAAGEVIERPASVVKELVENSLDAGATTVSVEVEGGGKRSIRVVDDGRGMSPADARMCLQRHATSKIRRIEDLFALATMGFRGEALPSIAAVSRMAITTRTVGALAGTRLVVDAGTVIEAGEIGAPVGTCVEVRDLLFNVPARMKFLKGEPTEASHITEVVTRIAMAHPSVHVRLKHGARTALHAPPHRDGLDRARALLGERLAERLHRARAEEGGVAVDAYLAAPELAQTTSRGVQLYVGRRWVRDRGLLHALVMGYGELLPRGRYPVAVLFVDVAGPAVDVNVHPQKLEVRFSDAQAVYGAVRHTVGRAVARAPWLDERAGFAPVQIQAVAVGHRGGPAAQAPGAWRSDGGATATGSPPGPVSALARGHAADRERTLFSYGRARTGATPAARGASHAGEAGAAGSSATSPAPWDAAPDAPAPWEAPVTSASPTSGLALPAGDALAPSAGGFFARLRYLGQLDRTYLVCEGAGELILVDQHAAHERVEFQRLRERHAAHALPVQRLLFPQRIELGDAEAGLVDEHAAALAAVGFEIEPFGGASFALAAVPAGLRGGDPAAVLRALLDELADCGGSRAFEERLDAVFATLACHSVVRAGDALSAAEAEALLAGLDGVDFNAHCPHGRPVLLRISVSEIARRCGRT
jgi:DNA mismatch repair protein MutL